MPTAVRCSSLDSLFSCPASILASGPALVRIAAENEAASLGKAVHECCATLIPKGSYDVDAASERHGISDEAKSEAIGLLFYATKAWQVLAKYFNPDPGQRITEAGVTGPVLENIGGEQYQITGTIDLCSPVDQDKAIFLDWKSGYIDDGFYQQMSGYAYLLWCHMGRPERVSITGVVVFLRHQYWRVLRFNAEMLGQWERDLIRNQLNRPDSFRPGRACPHCELFSTCPARQAVSVQTIKDILGGADHPDRPGWWDRAKAVLSQLSVDNKAEKVVGETVSDVVFRIRMLSALVDAAKDVLRDSIRRVGPIPLGDGVELGLRPVFIEKIRPEVAMPLLRNYLSDGQMTGCMTLSLPKLLTTYANSKPGESGWKKSVARKMLHGKLLDAGAVTVTRQERLEEVHSDPQETDDGNNSGESTEPGEPTG